MKGDGNWYIFICNKKSVPSYLLRSVWKPGLPCNDALISCSKIVDR